jgi:hypothetical protein
VKIQSEECAYNDGRMTKVVRDVAGDSGESNAQPGGDDKA